MTENDKLYEFELKPGVDLASHELRKMADARTQYTDGRFAVLSNLMREMTDREVESAKWDIRDLASASIAETENKLFGILLAVDRVVYPE